jgi:hypothetical protein
LSNPRATHQRRASDIHAGEERVRSGADSLRLHTELEYGQKAGRRVGVAIMVSPLALFSKKRNHYLTITYTDSEGKEQAAVFELGKDIVRTSVKIVETRSGKDVQYQDDDARKSLGGGKVKRTGERGLRRWPV